MEPVLTRHMGPGQRPPDLRAYQADGGYAALRQAIGQKTPEEIVAVVTDSGLRGRGGAGFPTGVKWKAMPPPSDGRRPRILVCNFDEMEPGTYKDRYLAEGDPHQLVEGMAIAGYANVCDVGYIFIRWEYRQVAELLERAIGEARAAGLLGKDVLGSGWSFDVHVHVSAGRYICGEETAMLSALEGRRGNPRSKPPYPMAVGAWGKPTVPQNVETLCTLPHIVSRGALWFRSLGKAKDAGMKIYGASGRLRSPRCVELPMGTTLRELLFEHMGGMADGTRFRAALPGGSSTRFLGEAQLDVPLDFSSLKDIGCYLGTGTAVVMDDRTCPVDMARNLEKFYARESCGYCTPCREGLPWAESVLADIEEGRGEPGDVDRLIEQARLIGPNTFCAFALGAVQPLESSIALFRDEYEAHIRLHGCPMRGGR